MAHLVSQSVESAVQYCNLTLDTPERNLALDELLLNQAQSGERNAEVLRIWHARQQFIVLGRSSKAAVEVDLSAANAAGIPVLRRISGGATIMAAPGCMFYSALLSLELRPQLRMLDEAHRFVMQRVVDAIKPLRSDVQLDGTCDVVVPNIPEPQSPVPQSPEPATEPDVAPEVTPHSASAEKRLRKVSGNALRVQRDWLLYHGTLLLDMELSQIQTYLNHPPREPEYRLGRSHQDFIANLNVSASALDRSLQATWRCSQPYPPPTSEEIETLVAQKYALASWNLQR